MRVAEALDRATGMLIDHPELDAWRVAIDPRPKKRMGQTRYATRTIGLSKVYVELNDWSVVEAIMLHEMAHAMVGPGKGHGPVWKAQARALGLRNPAAGYRDPGLVSPPYISRDNLPVVVTCPIHGEVFRKARMPRAGARYRHNACGSVVIFSRESAQVGTGRSR